MEIAEISTDILWKKPVEYKFSQAEINTIKEEHPRWKFRVLYGIWKQIRRNGLYIWVAIDQMPECPRQSPFLNSSHVIANRALHPLEHDEFAQNYGRNNRRFIVWHYRNIDGVVADDEKYGIETPKEFFKQAKLIL